MRREIAGRNCFRHATDCSDRTDKLLSGWTMLTGGTHIRTHTYANTDRHRKSLFEHRKSLFTGISTQVSNGSFIKCCQTVRVHQNSHLTFGIYCFISYTIPRTCTIYCFVTTMSVTTAFFTWKLHVKTLQLCYRDKCALNTSIKASTFLDTVIKYALSAMFILAYSLALPTMKCSQCFRISGFNATHVVNWSVNT